MSIHYRKQKLCRELLAKPLPRAALSKEVSVKIFSAKASLPRAFYRALGKVFAERHDSRRQRKVAVTG